MLGPEILDDHLLHVAVPLGEVADRAQRLDPFLARLADTDQDPGREGNPFQTRALERLEAPGGNFVRRAVVRTAAFRQPVGRGLEHQAHRRADPSKLA